MTKTATFAARIDAIVERRVNEAVDRIIQQMLDDSTDEPKRRIGQMERRAEPNRPKREIRAQKRYRALTVTRGRNAGQPVEPKADIPAAYDVVYRAVLKAKGKGITARELIAATGSKPKTVESALWFLRQRAEAVESFTNGD